MFLRWKKENVAKLVDMNFLADNMKNLQAILCQNSSINGCFLQVI